MNIIQGGVCAAKGFQAAGVRCGVRKNKNKRDLALIMSDRPAAAACVYTTNLVQGAPIQVTREHVKNGYAQAILCNSGNANTCNDNGVETAEAMCGLLAKESGIAAADVIVASTGVIGQPLPIQPIEAGMPALVQSLGDNSADAAEAIMTTDLRRKETAVEFQLSGKTCRLGGIAKGSGMIHPNMATMLVFLTTDAAISPALLQKALKADIADTFHMISVDGDTSTNDMVSILANGAAENTMVTGPGADYDAFCAALRQVTTYLCRAIARDGEGATKLVECAVTGATDRETARVAAKGVICSSLFKAAMFGADANWGRVLCALGYCGAALDIHKVDVAFRSQAGYVAVCRAGAGIPFSEETAKAVLSADEIRVEIELHSGAGEAVAWGCDLSYDYVKINGDYRT